jgi:hypothetical protein
MNNVKSRDELLTNSTVRQQIAERAYFISERHGFAPGRDMEFWLSAEEEVLNSLLGETPVETTIDFPPLKKPRKAPVKKAVVETAAPIAEAAPVKKTVRRSTKKAD